MKKPTKILIVEDETLIAASISVELDELGYEVAGVCTRGKQAIAFCEETQPDVVLLDIQLKGEMDGIAVGHHLKEQRIPFIYLTANTDQATFDRAKDSLPYAFISKPHKKVDLQRALALVVSRLAVEEDAKKRSSNQLTKPNSYFLTDRIFVRHKDKIVKVDIDDIHLVKADGSYCLVYTSSNEYILTFPMKTLEDYLPSRTFIRTHRSFLINLDKIEAITDNQEVLLLGNNLQAPISRRYKQVVLERLRLF